MGFFSDLKKRRTVGKIIRKLPGVLERSYGKQDYYNSRQVKTAITACGFNNDCIAYAYALFCSPQEFEETRKKTNQSDGYSKLHREISNWFSRGNNSFNIHAGTHLSDNFSGGNCDAGFSDSSGGSSD